MATGGVLTEVSARTLASEHLAKARLALLVGAAICVVALAFGGFKTFSSDSSAQWPAGLAAFGSVGLVCVVAYLSAKVRRGPKALDTPIGIGSLTKGEDRFRKGQNILMSVRVELPDGSEVLCWMYETFTAKLRRGEAQSAYLWGSAGTGGYIVATSIVDDQPKSVYGMKVR
jgi:hypothetical protein